VIRAWAGRLVRKYLVLPDPDPQLSRLDLFDLPAGQ
jgi:hypothetical protein